MANMNWKSKTQLDQEAQAQALETLRAERDAKLRGSDWTQLPDAPTQQVQAWRTYRQALRNLPQQAQGKSAQEIKDIPFPTPPE